MNKIDGTKIAGEIVEKLKEKEKPEKILAAVYVGSNPASEAFLKVKEKAAKELGVDFRVYSFSESISGEKLREEVGRISKMGVAGGVIVQLPLPDKFNKQKILNAVDLEKDVDVLAEKSLGAFYAERSAVLPPAVGVIKEILEKENVFKDLGEKKVAIVGAGFLVGKPAAVWFLGKVAEVAVFDKGSNLEDLKKYDLVVSGVGKAGLIKTEFLKEGAGVIDFGYDDKGSPSTGSGYNSKRVIGDLDASDEKKLEKLTFWTPTPGGTGPILVAKLMENFYELFERKKKKE